MQEVQSTIQPLVEQHGNRFELVCSNDLGWIETDVLRLRQIVINLLGNAFKFTENGTVKLTVRRFAADGREWFEFEVRDSGIGMTTEQCAKVFTSFNQADSSTTRRFGGTGLGLAISKNLSTLLGGDIFLESTPGVGSMFSVVVPAVLSSLLPHTRSDGTDTSVPRPDSLAATG